MINRVITDWSGKMLRTLLLLLLLTPALAWAQDNRLKNNRLTFEGESRQYLSYAPRNAESLSGARPLLIVLHGGGGTARQISRATKRRFDRWADQQGFFVVYPNAIGKLWDTGGGVISQSLSPRRNDLGFLEQVIAQMSAKYPIDQTRVFATGISRGGHAAFMLACRSTKIRAIGVVAMNLPKHLTQSCSRPRGLILINGTKDPLVPFDGGHVTAFGNPRDLVISATETLGIFARHNGCGTPSTPERIDPEDDGTVIDYQTWRCRKAPLAFYKVIGGGHTWPSERSILPEFLVGPISRDIIATDRIVNFFLSIE